MTSSCHHPLVVATTESGGGTVVCDVELGFCFQLPVRARAAAFAPDGCSFVTGCWDDEEEGLWTWDIGNVLDLRGSNAYEGLNTGEQPSKLVGERLYGHQVFRSLCIRVQVWNSFRRARCSRSSLFAGALRRIVIWALGYHARPGGYEA